MTNTDFGGRETREDETMVHRIHVETEESEFVQGYLDFLSYVQFFLEGIQKKLASAGHAIEDHESIKNYIDIFREADESLERAINLGKKTFNNKALFILEEHLNIQRTHSTKVLIGRGERLILEKILRGILHTDICSPLFSLKILCDSLVRKIEKEKAVRDAYDSIPFRFTRIFSKIESVFASVSEKSFFSISEHLSLKDVEFIVSVYSRSSNNYRDIASNLVAEAKGEHRLKEVRLDIDFEKLEKLSDLPDFLGAEYLLEQYINNSIENAIRSKINLSLEENKEEYCRIEIAMRCDVTEDGYMEFVIADNGRFPGKDGEDIFEFEEGKTGYGKNGSEGVIKGNGVGSDAIRAIAEAFGGQHFLRRGKNGGSESVLRLPLAPQDPDLLDSKGRQH